MRKRCEAKGPWTPGKKFSRERQGLGNMASMKREPITGVWGQNPQRVQVPVGAFVCITTVTLFLYLEYEVK